MPDNRTHPNQHQTTLTRHEDTSAKWNRVSQNAKLKSKEWRTSYKEKLTNIKSSNSHCTATSYKTSSTHTLKPYKNTGATAPPT
jgi:hypothetical protein